MQNKLSTITLAAIATTLLLGSTAVLAANYKGDYKGEAMAAPCPQLTILKDGFYLGAQVGYDSYRTRVSNSVGVGATGVSYGINPVVASTGFAGGIFGGYGMYWNNFYYLAGEVFVNGSDANQSQSVNSLSSAVAPTARYTTQKASVGASWGVSALPGVKVNESTLTYIRLGYEQAKLTGQSTFIAGPTTGETTLYNSNTNWQSGFQYGIGMETAVYPNLGLRGEFSHVSYSGFSDNNGTNYTSSDNQYMLGLTYHFA